MAKRKKRKPYRQRPPLIRTNQRIRAREVRVVEDGGDVGDINHDTMQLPDALALAKSKGLDLVEIAPNARPPVCRICNFGKYKYDQEKRKKSTPKTKGGKTKEVKFRVGIDPHDYEIKMTRGEQFLDENNKLKVSIMFRGRQMAHKEIGFDLAKQIVEDFETMAQVDFEARMSGRFITMQLSPLPDQQRKRKFTSQEVDEEDDGYGGDEEE